MPIGVPRIIYCWGEELPAQWTDIYNFIFRRRMVFLMQYLDDELCNQICGLLINIHMEDRSKELEKKEMEKSGLFKSGTPKTKGADERSSMGSAGGAASAALSKKVGRQSLDDLLTSDQDFGIEDNHMLEQYTLQKITTEWLNWNSQFFERDNKANSQAGFSGDNEPYLYYLADILSKDFSGEAGNLKYGTSVGPTEMTKLIKTLKLAQSIHPAHQSNNSANTNLDIYSPFRLLANFAADNYNLENLQSGSSEFNTGDAKLNKKLMSLRAQQKFTEQFQTRERLQSSAEKALGQRRLKSQYRLDRLSTKGANMSQARSYLASLDQSNLANESGRSLYRKQTERVIQEEESKKVFMIINSFGGSVGNGITVHDALQFIKAGSLTLALGVAASAASLALAGGTIGERYVTEGCHTMIHQPEGGLNGQASDIWIDSQEIMKIRLDVAEIYSLSTYRPRHKILRDLDRDFYLTAMETIYYGLADEIATNDVLHDIIEMTNKVWDYHDSKQQRLLETRDSQTSGLDTQTQS
jgi:ATP-dependent Clp protease protease subunit